MVLLLRRKRGDAPSESIQAAPKRLAFAKIRAEITNVVETVRGIIVKPQRLDTDATVRFRGERV